MEKKNTFEWPIIGLIPGTILHSKYRINGMVGRDDFGITYDGTDIESDLHVAIKEYFPYTMASRQAAVTAEVTCCIGTQIPFYEQGVKSFLEEGRNLAEYAGDENIVSVLDWFSENNTAYIISEFVEGQTLIQYLQKHGCLTMEESMAIIAPVMNALEKIHARNMIHRNVSPSNIMILPDGRVKLMEFRAARNATMEPEYMSAAVLFKYDYAPIEQLTRKAEQGPYTDVYALCATLYRMLTGSTPPSSLLRIYEDNLVPPSKEGVRIGKVQQDTLLRGLALRSSDRIQTIAELREGLRRDETTEISEGWFDVFKIQISDIIGKVASHGK